MGRATGYMGTIWKKNSAVCSAMLVGDAATARIWISKSPGTADTKTFIFVGAITMVAAPADCASIGPTVMKQFGVGYPTGGVGSYGIH